MALVSLACLHRLQGNVERVDLAADLADRSRSSSAPDAMACMLDEVWVEALAADVTRSTSRPRRP